jgi:hypothetical protein
VLCVVCVGASEISHVFAFFPYDLHNMRSAAQNAPKFLLGGKHKICLLFAYKKHTCVCVCVYVCVCVQVS